jgi:hypothetical protein
MTLSTITKTAQEVVTHVKRQFGDESGAQITDTDIIRWINSGQLEIVTRNKVLKGKATTNVVDGTATYSLPTVAALQIESIHYDGKVVRGVDLAQAEKIISGSDPERTREGEPVLWYEWASEVTFSPTPNENITDGLTVYYSKLPTDITLVSDTLSVPDIYFEALVSWVLSKAYELDEEFKASDLQKSYFEQKLGLQLDEERDPMRLSYPLISIVE